MVYLIFILASFGLTKILVSGNIFKRIRPKNKFFHCSLCMGFWVGLLIYILFFFSGQILFYKSLIGVIAGAFIFGWISSGTSYLLDKVIGDNGISINLK